MSPPKFSAKFKSRYLVKGPLGQGGMAEVFLAFDKELMRDVAVKVLSPLSTTGNSRKRFEQEGRFTASLQHPHIVTLHGYGEDEDRPYLVFEYVQGKSLRDLLKLRRRLDIGRSLTLITQMADGLHHAHELEIIHRDLKPENILITEAGEAKIADFGLAKVGPMTNVLTQEGMVLGTPGYLAPEVIQGEQATSSSDFYSLSIVLFEMLHGQLPFSGATEREMLVNYIRLPAPTLVDLGYEVPRPLSDFVSRALSRKPEKRYSNGKVYLSELKIVTQAINSWASADPLRLTEPIKLKAAEPVEEPDTRDLSEAAREAAVPGVTEKRPAMGRQNSGRQRGDGAATAANKRTAAPTPTANATPYLVGIGAMLAIVGLLAGLFWMFGRDKEKPLAVSEKFRLTDGPRVTVGANSVRLTWSTNAPTWTTGMMGPVGGEEKLVKPPVLPHQPKDANPENTQHQLTVWDLEPGKRYHFQPTFSDGHRGDRDLTFQTLPEPQDLIESRTLAYLSGKVEIHVTLVTSLTAELHVMKKGDRDPKILETESPSNEHRFEVPLAESDEVTVSLRFRELRDEIPFPTLLGPRLIAKRLTEKFQDSSESFQKLEDTLADRIRKAGDVPGGNTAGKTRDTELTRLRADFESFLDQELGLPAESLLGSAAILLADEALDCATQGAFHERLDRLVALDRLAKDELGSSFLQAPPDGGTFLQVEYPELVPMSESLLDEKALPDLAVREALSGGGLVFVSGVIPGRATSRSSPRALAQQLAAVLPAEGGRLKLPLGDPRILAKPYLFIVMKVAGLSRASRLTLRTPSGVVLPVRIDRDPPALLEPDTPPTEGDLEKIARVIQIKIPGRCFPPGKPHLEIGLEPEPLAGTSPKAAVFILDLRLGG